MARGFYPIPRFALLTFWNDALRYIALQRDQTTKASISAEVPMQESTMRDPREGFGRCGAPGEMHGPVRFKFGHGPHGHGFGPHGRGPWSRARRGNVRAAILSVLSEEPMHGYQIMPVSYTHLRAHETVLDLVCR